jgi:hypothetical protein
MQTQGQAEKRKSIQMGGGQLPLGQGASSASSSNLMGGGGSLGGFGGGGATKGTAGMTMGEIARQMAFMRGENDVQVVGNGFDDMTQIDNLTESTILLNLNVRYMQDKIYVC